MTGEETLQLQPLILAILGSGAITAFVSWLLSRRKSSAETEGIVADTYSKILADMKSELIRYQEMLTAANKRIYNLELKDNRKERRIHQLERALWDAHIPIPMEEPYGHEESGTQLDFWDHPEKGTTDDD